MPELLAALSSVNYRTLTGGRIDRKTLSDHVFMFCNISPFGPDGTWFRLCSANIMNRITLCQSIKHVMNKDIGDSWSTPKSYAFDRARAVVQAGYINSLFFSPSNPIDIFVSQETTRFLEEALHERFPDTYIVYFVEEWGEQGGIGSHAGGYATILRKDSTIKVDVFEMINIGPRGREKNVGMLTVLSFEGKTFRLVNIHIPCKNKDKVKDSNLKKFLEKVRVLSLSDAYLVGDFNMAPRQVHFPDHIMRTIEHTGGNWSDHCLYLERKPLPYGLAIGGGGGSACVMPVEPTPDAEEVLKEVVLAPPAVAKLYVPPSKRAPLQQCGLAIGGGGGSACVMPYVPPCRILSPPPYVPTSKRAPTQSSRKSSSDDDLESNTDKWSRGKKLN
jgi:hypothetical protein